MDGIEKIGLQIGSQLVKGGAIRQGPGMAVVLVLFDEHMTCDSDLPFQLDPGCRRVHEPHDHDAARRGIEWMREHR